MLKLFHRIAIPLLCGCASQDGLCGRWKAVAVFDTDGNKTDHSDFAVAAHPIEYTIYKNGAMSLKRARLLTLEQSL